MSIFCFSSILVFVSNMSLAVLLLLKGRNKPATLWAGVCLSLAIWGMSGIGIAYSSSVQIAKAELWWQIAHIGLILLPIYFFHFVYTFLELKQKSVLSVLYLVGSILIIVDLFEPRLLLGDLRYLFNSIYWVSRTN